MTPFAQLNFDPSLEKTAAGAGLIGRLVRDGVWKTVGQSKSFTGKGSSGWRKGVGNLSKAFYTPHKDPTKGRSTLLSKGLSTYGWGGIGASLMGVNLPGSNLALNASMPGIGALFTAPGAITSARMSTQKNKDRLKGDVESGAREAASNLLTGVNSDPRVGYQPGAYRQWLESNGVPFDTADQYSGKKINPIRGWDYISSMFENPQKLIDNKIDTNIQGALHKFGSVHKQAAAKALWGGAKAAFPWIFPTMGVGMVGHALLKDKPYDETSAMQKGYGGAQAVIDKKLQNLTGIQRMALRLDPSLMGRELNKQFPGTIGAWEKSTGLKHKPGWISSTMDAWQKGGPPTYYNVDAAGERHYIE